MATEGRGCNLLGLLEWRRQGGNTDQNINQNNQSLQTQRKWHGYKNRSWNGRRDGTPVVNTHYLNVTECELQGLWKLQKIEGGILKRGD